jgi:hypothetical protein
MRKGVKIELKKCRKLKNNMFEKFKKGCEDLGYDYVLKQIREP